MHLDDVSFADVAKKDEALGAQKWRVYNDLPVRAWDAPVRDARLHVFVLPLEHAVPFGDENARWRILSPPRDLMHGVDADAPPGAFAGREHVALARDGAVAFTSKPRSIESAWSVSTVVHLLRVVGDAPDAFVAETTAANPGMDTQPAFSPSGARLAYLSSRRAQRESDRLELVLHVFGSRLCRRVAFASLDVSLAGQHARAQAPTRTAPTQRTAVRACLARRGHDRVQRRPRGASPAVRRRRRRQRRRAGDARHARLDRHVLAARRVAGARRRVRSLDNGGRLLWVCSLALALVR